MNVFFVNVLLAAAWGALTGVFTPVNLAAGFLLGYGVLWLVLGKSDSASYFEKLPRALNLARFFVWELLLANLRVSRNILAPRNLLRPGIVAVPLDVTSAQEITLLAGLVTLTPGTLSLDISDDRRTLYVHCMHLEDAEAEKRVIKEGFERRVKELFA